MWVADGDIPEMIGSALQEIDDLGRSGDLREQMDKIIHVFSCRAAVKANKPLTREEMERLLKDLGNTRSPHTCEHGRPTMIRIDLQEIERRFQRH
jgi:DNA mismatch repair protein MutL